MKRITKIENETRKTRKTRVAAYCRVSTGSDEQLVSLEAQKQHYTEMIKSNPKWTSAGMYFDEGITGTKKDKRPALMRMISDCENGKIDLIVTKSISRFARNTTDCLELVRKLAEMGVYIFFERENINTEDMEGELMLTILSSLAEEESASISQNSKWSIQKRYQNGTFIIGYPPYGYANINGRMEIVPEEAEIVKQMFDSFLSGMSTSAIADDLNERNIRTKKGGYWRARTVNAILKNEKYTGDVIFQKTWSDDRFNRHNNHGEVDQYVMRDHHEAIVSREKFDAVQDLMKTRFSEKGGVWGSDKYSRRYAFSGRIICGECGGAFKRQIRKNTKFTRISWCCTEHIRDKKHCRMKAINEDAIQAGFITVMNKLTYGRDAVLKPLLNALKSSDRTEGFDRISELERKLEENAKHRERLRTMLTQGLLDAEIFNDENNLLLSEYERMETELSDLRAGINSTLTQISEIDELIRHLGSGEMQTEYDEEQFLLFVDHIIIHSASDIEFVLKCGLRLREKV
jgi:site-specific DNA recombinase